MNLSRPLTSFALCALLAHGTAAAQERKLQAERIAPGVFVITSTNLADPNTLAVVGSDQVLLVDGLDHEGTNALLEVLGEVTATPLRHVVLTHWHPDHTMGNATFRSRGATIVAHENAQRRMKAGSAIAFFGLDIPAYPAEALADRTLVSAETLQVGNSEVHLIPLPPAHTDGDLLVHIPAANVIHMGDVKMGGMYPFIELSSGGDVQGLIAALDRAIELANDQTVVVPGHGPLRRRADLVAYRGLLATVWSRVQQQVARGRSLEQVLAARPAVEFDAEWSTPVISTDAFVGILFQAARGERTRD